MKKVLFVTPHRLDRSPSQRFRFEQYLNFLNENGYQWEISYLITPSDDKVFYKPGHLFSKAWIMFRCYLQRFRDCLRASGYDLIFIQREAFFLGTTFFERWMGRKTKVIFDFDDAIWNFDISAANKKFSFLKNPSKTAEIIKASDMIFAGNQYLADYALQYHKNVKIIPTTIDTEEYKPERVEKSKRAVCIGWSGSITTIVHFKLAEPILKKIKDKYGDRVYFKVVGDGTYVNEELGIKGLPWIKADELKELNEMDIGMMPLPDDKWAKGKCGLKGIQYMALEIPTIMSPVGVNLEIIQDGENGFLATEIDEWVDKLSRLIESAELRNKMGKSARKTVLDKYSVEANKGLYLKYFNEVTA